MESCCSPSGEPPLNPCPIKSSSSRSLLLPSTSAGESVIHASININNALESGPQRLVKIYSYVYLFVAFYRTILGFLYDRKADTSESLLSTSDDHWGIHRFENLNVSTVIGSPDTPQHSKESFPPSLSHLTLLFTATHAQLSIVPDLTGQVTRGTDSVFSGNYSTVLMGDWNGIKVAIKDIRGQGTLVATKRRLRREREVWGCLKHENILPLHGYVDDFGSHGALISPWYKNGQSGDYIRKSALRAPQRFKLWCDVIKGMVYLHSLNPVLIHGDLKPMNVLVDDEGHARICDFGLVRILSDEAVGFNTTTTHTGTARYLAYELVVDDRPIPTTATDVHAVGCIGLDFIFLTSPYANCKRYPQLFVSVGKKIPPATKIPMSSEPSGPILELWEVLNACWSAVPQIRPSVLELERFVGGQRVALMAALNVLDG